MLGYDALEIGLAFLPVTIVMGVLSVALLGAADHAVRRAQRGCCPGLALIAVGLCLFTRAPVDGNYVRRRAAGDAPARHRRGRRVPGADDLAMSGATPEDAGLASGLVNTTAQVGGALGLAVLATLSSSRTDALRDGGASVASALTSGYHLAFLIGAALVLAAIAVGLTVVRSDGPTAEGVGAEPAVAEAA